jgi:hypothetical protein
LWLVRGAEGAITGTVVCAAVIAFGVGHAETTAELSVGILVTVGVYWVAHLHAVTISNALKHGHHPLRDFEHALAETAPIAIVSVLPLGVLLLATLLGADLSTSAWWALLATVALLAAYSYLAGVRGGLGRVGCIASATAGAAIGVLVALLKLGLH